MLTLILILFVGLVLYSLLKGELQYIRDTLEIQLRQARFRLDRLERRVRELEEPASQPRLDAAPAVLPDSGASSEGPESVHPQAPTEVAGSSATPDPTGSGSASTSGSA